jgi:lipoprotein-anchoring transpeptidase ErfK/SrfK
MKRISVSVGTQALRLWEGFRLVKEWPCSTSKFGLGSKEGSLKTPLGHFRVVEKYGEGAAWGTVFKSRLPVGQWLPGGDTVEDLVLTRILRLEGLQGHNANTYDRYIYIHGTNDEHGIGWRGSHGCVRMRNDDVTELYDLVPEGTQVWIQE